MIIRTLIAVLFSIMFGPSIEEEKSYVVIYNIQDLEMILPNYSNVPEISVSSALNGSQGNIFNDSSSIDNRRLSKDYESIITLIENTIEPEIWNNQSTASIKYWKGNLIVTAPKRIHDQIR